MIVREFHNGHYDIDVLCAKTQRNFGSVKPGFSSWYARVSDRHIKIGQFYIIDDDGQTKVVSEDDISLGKLEIICKQLFNECDGWYELFTQSALLLQELY